MNLNGKTVAITGCTGGLGRELCLRLASLGANLIMVDRNPLKSQNLANEILIRYNINITSITADMEDIDSVKRATANLIKLKPNYFVANAGVYNVPRYKVSSGFDNVFQINFVSPYYIACRLSEEIKNIKIIGVGSIAHTYSVIDENDIDFKTRKSSALAYGNSKRFLMLALGEKFKDEARLSIVHPGITFTNITDHFPKLIFAIIKHPMKVIFMKPKKAVSCILEGFFQITPKGYWIGPALFDIWGKPQKKKLRASFTEDSQKAIKIAEKIYKVIK